MKVYFAEEDGEYGAIRETTFTRSWSIQWLKNIRLSRRLRFEYVRPVGLTD
jgi:hypothetical protein